MLTRLLVYAYCLGEVSSRKIEKATHEDVAFRYLAADQHPDHDTIAHFRREHLERLGQLFVQGLELCREAGLVKLGRVMLDGTKIAASASRRKSLKYEKLQRCEAELEQQVAELLQTAEAADSAEDARYGKGQRGDELPVELADRQLRLQRLGEAKARLEQRRKQKRKKRNGNSSSRGPVEKRPARRRRSAGAGLGWPKPNRKEPSISPTPTHS